MQLSVFGLLQVIAIVPQCARLVLHLVLFSDTFSLSASSHTAFSLPQSSLVLVIGC